LLCFQPASFPSPSCHPPTTFVQALSMSLLRVGTMLVAGALGVRFVERWRKAGTGNNVITVPL
jgi:hypothetical protein